jgi:hypothetical protein
MTNQHLEQGSRQHKSSHGLVWTTRLLLLGFSLAAPLQAAALTAPDSFDISVPAGSNNASTGNFTCSGGPPLSCAGFTNPVIDDVILESVTFGSTTFSASSDEIIFGIASVLSAGDGGGDVNAEWGDGDDNADGNDQPFAKAGYDVLVIGQESTDPNVVDETIERVFSNRSLAEGVDGESENYVIALQFEKSVRDNDGTAIDSRPEILVFERGLNSDVTITLLLDDGGTSDPLILDELDFVDSGLELDTVEIGSGQALGVIGVDLNEFSGAGFDPSTATVRGVQFGSAGNGADIFGVFGLTQDPGDLNDFGDNPDSYGTDTTNTAGEGIGPSHGLDADLFLGRNPPDSELDGQPSAGALADGLDETETYTFPSGTFGPGDVFSVEVGALNLTGSAALLCGWIDFNDDGSFQNTDTSAQSTDAERECQLVATGSVSTGSTPDTTTLNFTIPDDFAQPPSNAGYYSRFRLTSDWQNASEATALDPVSNGEVEDVLIDTGTLPVSISGFETVETRGGLEVRWSTVSETENVGFHLWNFSGGTLEPVTSQLIPSKTSDAAHPQSYSYTIPRAEAKSIGQLAITAVDNRGNEEMYGLFEIGRTYGRDDASTPIAWDSIRAQAEARLASLGFAETGGSWRDTDRPRQPTAADFQVTEAGMQRITHDDLMAAGIDLRGRSFDQIAVTVDGEAVPRSIRTIGLTDSAFSRGAKGSRNANRFSDNSVIEFWGEAPSFPNARYVDHLVYRVALDSADVIAAGEAPKDILLGTSESYMQSLRDDRDQSYRMSAVLEDPWSLAELRSWVPSKASHTSHFELPKNRIAGQAGRIEVLFAGGNDLDVSPDHHVQVRIAGQTVAEDFFDGRRVRQISAEVPAELLEGDNVSVEVRLPGGTESNIDVVLLESIDLRVPTTTRAVGERLIVPDYEPGHYVRAAGFVQSGHTAWAWNGNELLSVPTENAGRGMIRAVPPAEDGYALWISSGNALHRPEPIGAVGANTLLDEAGDFLVIAHPAFLPSSPREAHPLNDFVEAREAQGWNVRLVDVTEVQAHYGGGMPLPQAVRRFLAAADSQFAYEHVLLVGSDSYDYRDILEMGSMSFIPTFYAATDRIAHTPSDGLLADIDGDGVSDKAIGRWPVRTLADLESIVYKTLDWNGSMEGLRNAVWVADLEDPGQPSFQAQATRLMDQLVKAGWTQSQIDSIFLDDVANPDIGRDQLFGLLEQGRAFTGFVGHGAPSMWTFDGLLVPNDLAGLDNFGLPTMISTSTCYTSYFVSPYSETVAHRWMNGYDEDAQGNPIPGARNGAVAIHGAATLSKYMQNEFVVSKVQGYQLEGMTLGQAVLLARRDAAENGLFDQVINWGLLGDPTLVID